MFWICVNTQRQFWAMSKSSMKQENPDFFNISLFGNLDFCQFLCYSMTQIFTGSLGDFLNKKYLVAASFFIQAVVLGLLAYAGAMELTSHAYFIACFVFLGISQSVIFPSLVSTVGSWFSKQHRGVITGSWATSTNIGHIVGAQAAAMILKKRQPHDWYILMEINAISYLVCGLLAVSVFMPYPQRFDLMIDKDVAIDVWRKQNMTMSEQSLIEDDQSTSRDPSNIQREEKQKPMTPWEAIKIPGVVLYGFSFFCTRMSVTSIVNWLPLFLD